MSLEFPPNSFLFLLFFLSLEETPNSEVEFGNFSKLRVFFLFLVEFGVSSKPNREFGGNSKFNVIFVFFLEFGVFSKLRLFPVFFDIFRSSLEFPPNSTVSLEETPNSTCFSVFFSEFGDSSELTFFFG